MPIRPENKARYPENWHEISLAIRARAGNRCEDCAVPNHELGGRDSRGRWYKAAPKGTNGLGLDWPVPGESSWCYRGEDWQLLRIVRIVLTVAHLDHQPENCAPENLKAWCQRCHNIYDAAMRRAGIQARERERMACSDLFEGVAT
jgi:hypothetical protein